MTRSLPLLLLLLLLSLPLAGCSHTLSPAAQHGREHVQYYGCGSCHTISSVPGARATVGPPLDEFGARAYIAGTLPNSPQNLAFWIQHPQAIHPGTAMPEMGVTPSDAAEMAAYLDESR